MPSGSRAGTDRGTRRRSRGEDADDVRGYDESDDRDGAGTDIGDDDPDNYDGDDYDDPAEDDDGYDDEDVLPADAAARVGLRHIAELTGKAVTGVVSLDRSDGGWTVGVEVVEDRRIPSSADILAVYQVEIDGAGELRGYRRTRRYPRGRGDADGVN